MTYSGPSLGKNITAAEKAALLDVGGSNIKGVAFIRQKDMVGAEAVFMGSRASGGPRAGFKPVAAVLDDGTVVKGWTQPNPFRAVSYTHLTLPTTPYV